MKPSDINPELPVWKKETLVGTVFSVTRASHFMSPTFGKTWRLHVVTDDGEMGLLLQGANEVRDDTFALWARHLDNRPADFIGPCTVSKTPATQKGQSDRYDIVDAPEALIAARDGEAKARALAPAAPKAPASKA